MIVLLHSSKTMRAKPVGKSLRPPALLEKARTLNTYLKTLSVAQLAQCMHISTPLATKTQALTQEWTTSPTKQSLALDTFLGDIYSGLRAKDLSSADRNYADKTLRVLSGLYGILRPYDGICPYRLEMEYKLPNADLADLHAYWGESIVKTLPKTGLIVNTASVEYSRTITPFVDSARLITPKFLTIDPATNEPIFVVVHAKIARGAFARWLITSRVTDPADFSQFSDLGYRYDIKLSTAQHPAFVCKAFGGIGLSMRLEK